MKEFESGRKGCVSCSEICRARKWFLERSTCQSTMIGARLVSGSVDNAMVWRIRRSVHNVLKHSTLYTTTANATGSSLFGSGVPEAVRFKIRAEAQRTSLDARHNPTTKNASLIFTNPP